MGLPKIVAKFKDGHRLRGHTANFNPTNPVFHLQPLEPAGGEVVTVELSLLKAVYFVKTFLGNPDYDDKKYFSGEQVYKGSHMTVQFTDGEIMVGSTPEYDSSGLGFFIFPADPRSNTIKVFAVNSSVRSARLIRTEHHPTASASPPAVTAEAPQTITGPADIGDPHVKDTRRGLLGWLKHMLDE